MLTEHGLKPIDQVEIGERVWSVDTEAGTVELRPVTNVFESQASEIAVVSIGSECVRCTPDHPFWVEGRGWVEARDLYDGCLVRTSQGLVDQVVHVELRAEPTIVYNLEVEGGHTYFVGHHAVLVHNACAYAIIKDGALYVGRTTRDLAVRLAEHGVEEGAVVRKVVDVSREAARGIEQLWMQELGGPGALLNKIWGISKNNPNLERYLDAGRRALGMN